MIRYFISDLHLSDKRPDLIRAFVLLTQSLKDTKPPAQLYILGDFYDAWIGDDFQSEWNDTIEQAIKKLQQANWQVFFLHGNRDFLIGKEWFHRTGTSPLSEQSPISELNLLLAHGDEYCTDDKEYQTFRSMVRSSAWQQQILSLPIEQRLALAAKLRNDSKTNSAEKNMEIMDVTKSAVEASLHQHQCHNMIHGHTHRPEIHNETSHIRCVLGDWDKCVWLARIEENEFIQSKCDVESFITSQLNALVEQHRQRLRL
ncbi:UDP-2,3-diacylglucosamine diphosphatase [Marinomonas sp.]